jgi:hypothetical protein
MQLLRDNLTLWTSDLADAAKDETEGKDLWATRYEDEIFDMTTYNIDSFVILISL